MFISSLSIEGDNRNANELDSIRRRTLGDSDDRSGSRILDVANL